jgi:flagellin-like protein
MISNRKGITPIISVILLLMMTIAIAGLAYTWLQRMQASVTNQTEESATRMLQGLNTQIRVDGVSLINCTGSDANVSIYFRNTGVNTANNLQLYISDQFISEANMTELDPGVSGNFSYEWVPALEDVPKNQWNDTYKAVKIASDEGVFESNWKFICR